MPHLTVIAGPNGSGKSTLIHQLFSSGIHLGEYINADDIAREQMLKGELGSLQAQELANEKRQQCLSKQIDFSFETVMSHPSKIEFMLLAKAAGYDVTLFFVCTEAVEINLRRVHNRVNFGGHDVPRDRVEARYRRTLDLLPDAIEVADRTVLFDNSQHYERPNLRPVADITRLSDDKFKLVLRGNTPDWARPILSRLANRT